ncbi:MAG: hypothetical protein COX65_08010 [Elusimicrobia bacterium CG_4_10_14_0_2_um_filter_56_8]|nr:MAG: hypothetical protein AUJ51_10710 [Elusimicrobia bacterium CG1_02_56_21]PJA12842.1 MAG: hypothetical protein COX65_08010 [Elusimicrobia bacterium CG_4_10_14_0_2_um_filter_56_8]
MKNKKGQVLVGVIVLLVILAIIIPTMVKYVQNEARWSVKQGQNTNAFQLAESAVDRGYQKIAESTSTWEDIQNGIPQAGFSFDTEYSDMSGGTYAISLTSGPESGEVTVLTVGRDKQKKETRALKVVYSKGDVNSAMYANGIAASGGVVIEWGPMKSLGSIVLTGASDVEYPRKYAVGSITGWPSISPCTDNLENWAYNCSPGVPPPPSIYLKGYEDEAKATKCPTANPFKFPNTASPAGSCYFPGNTSFNGTTMTSSGTVYVNGNLSVNNGFLYGNLIVTGNLGFTGNGAGQYHIPTAGAVAPFTGGIPELAWKEYMKLDTAASDEYYGDIGFQTVNSTDFWFKSGGATPAKSVGIKTNPAVRGFVYCAGALSSTGAANFHGVVYSPSGISGLGGNSYIFYDDNVAKAILTDTIYPSRVSWLDSKQPWPAGLP